MSKVARTVFLPKKDPAEDPLDFRPIAISSVVLRLFHKLLAQRIVASVDIDHHQRAFLPVDG